MSVAEERRAKFNALFNEKLGNKIGSPRTNYKDQLILNSLINSFSASKSGGGDSSSGISRKKTPEIPEDILELMQKNKESQEDKSLSKDLWDTISSPKKLMGAFGNGFMRAVDVVSRPGYAVRSGMLEVQKSINDGEPFWSLGDDVLWGAGQGAGGYRKTGFGDVLAEAKKYDSKNMDKGWGQVVSALVNPLAQGGAQISKRLPDEGEKWFDRGVGLTGDVVSDPATYLTGGATTVLKKGAGLSAKEAAKVAGKEAVDIAIRRNAKQAIDEIFPSLKNVRRQSRTAGKFGSHEVVDLRDDIIDVGMRGHENIINEVRGGAQKSKMVGDLKETSRTYAQSIGEEARNRMIEPTAKRYDDFLKKLQQSKVKGSKVKAWSAEKLAKEKADDPLFAIWHDTFVQARQNMNVIKANEKAMNAVSHALDADVMEIVSRMSLAMKDATMKVPTIRMLGNDIARFPKLGEGLQKAGRALEETPLRNFQKAFSYASNFPGYSTLIGQKVRALGNSQYEAFRDKVMVLAKDTTKEERKILHRALETGQVLSGKLEEKRLGLRALYDEMFQEEIASGVRRNARGVYGQNYAYTYLKKDTPKRSTFGSNRRLAVRTGMNPVNDKGYRIGSDLGQYTSAEAKKLGLRPEEDAFANILMKKIKSNRQMTRQAFREDLATHYGIKAQRLSPKEASRRGLKQIDHLLNKDLRRSLNLKDGEHLYLDEDINHIFTKYEDLSKVGSEEAKNILKSLDWVTRKFKTLNTIYFPGFHVRNFISDAYMGAMDGVMPKDYSRILRNWHKRETADIDIGGQTEKFSKLLRSYEENASSGGFLSTDIGRGRDRISKQETFSKDVLEHLKHPTSFPGAIRKGSEYREDFGRLAHFYHAMNEELPAAIRRYGKGDKAWEAAVNASTFRINKYKFDYGALTKVEQNVMRRGLPFYTYMRKAIPTLMESLYLSPRNLVYTNNAFNKIVGREEDFDGPVLPDYLKELGFLGLTKEDEPWGVTGGFLPQDVFSNTFSNPAANLNPLIRLLPEIATGKDTFTGKPNNTVADILKNNWRGASLYRKLSADEEKVDIKEKLASVVGIPLIQVTKEKQESQLKRYKGELNQVVKKFDEQAKAQGKHIYINKNNLIKVKDYVTGEVTTYPDLESALAALGMG